MSEYGLADDECIWVDTVVADDDLTFPSHLHPMAQLLWASHGTIAVLSGDTRWVLPPTQALWAQPETDHAVLVSRGAQLFSAHFWEEECPPRGPGLTPLAMSPVCAELLRHLAREDLDDTHARHARATLLGALVPTDTVGVTMKMPDDARALRVAESVIADPRDEHRLEDWAARVFTSSKTLQRCFVNDTGMSFTTWRTQARLAHSLPLLAERRPVAAVAEACGYSTVGGFARAFKQHFGTTPAEYFVS